MLIVKAAAFVAVMYAYFVSRVFMARRSRPRITYAPMSAMDKERQANLNKIYNCNDTECVALLRIRRAPFFNLCNLLRDSNLLRDTVHSNVEEQVAMFLHVVGHNQRFRVIHQNFRRSIETVSRYFREVLYAIGELRGEMIRPPSNETTLKISNNPRWYPYFKDCIGAIDGTHVRARVPAKIVAAFRGRKHYPTQNVMVAVDFDLKFTYVLAGWEGSAHDALILEDAIERDDGLRVPAGWDITMAWYVVTHGRRIGIFSSWEECHEHVHGFPGAVYKKYGTEEEATTAFYGTKSREGQKMADNNAIKIPDGCSAKSKDLIILIQSLVILVLVSIVVKMVWNVM